MHLSRPASLIPIYTEDDLLDLGHLYESVRGASESFRLRYDGIPKDELVKWFEASYLHDVATQISLPSISARHTDNKGDIDRVEHLVVRDLDLAPFSAETSCDRHSHTSGRIVAHIVFRYISRSREVAHPALDSAIVDKIPAVPPLPSSGNKVLHEKLALLVQSVLTKAFAGVKCYEVLKIATAAYHYRRGIAKQLLERLFAHADTDHLPVVLAASPPGIPLYEKCGFSEIGGPHGSVDLDLREYGGETLHQYTLMVRWPAGSVWQGKDWYEYREQHQTR